MLASVTLPAAHLSPPAHHALSRAVIAVSGALTLIPPMFGAATAPSMPFDLPADAAERSLRRFSRQSGAEVMFASGITKDIRTRGVKGEMTPRDALDAMLKDSGLVVFEDKSGAFSIRRPGPLPRAAERPAADAAEKSSPKTSHHQEPMNKPNVLTRLLAIVTLIVSAPAHAQDEGPGSVEGRVLNITTGNYLNNARVTIEGTAFEAFTNGIGEYRITNVPAGTVTVRANFTGLQPQAATVKVASGGRAIQDFSLSRAELGAPAASGETIVLDAFVTAATRDMSGREIAINEQRYAANLKNVVSADEFGDIAEGNVGEFLKFIPGITIDMVGPDARNISVRGLPPDATAVMVDGSPMASAASATASRVFELEQVSINNVSRVEVTKSPTPDLPANAVGGSVNMVSRSAFERSKPQFNYRAYFNWNTDQGLFDRTSVGPSRTTSMHTNPSFDFSYIRPVNKNFGFTFNGSFSDAYNADYRAQPQWIPTVSGSALSTADRPFLRNFTTFYGPKVTQRYTIGTTLDWRISHGNVLTFGAQWNYYDAFFSNKGAAVNTMGTITNQAPIAWGPEFTEGRPGGGSVNRNGSSRRKYGTTGHFSLKFVHDGPVWQIESGATYSDATSHYRDAEKGFVNTPSLTLSGITLRFDQIRPDVGIPQSVTATTAAGAPLDIASLAPYRISNIVFNEQDGRDLVTSARVNARREFNLPFLTSPVSLRTGLDVRRMDRDISDHNRSRYNFVGPDRSSAATSTDDFAGLYDIFDEGFYRDGHSGYGEPWLQYQSAYKLYDLFAAHPEYWTDDAGFRIQNEAIDSKKLTEQVSAAFLRTDWRFFHNRLSIVAGARYERTDTEGEGVLNDPTALYQHDAAGNLVRGTNGLPVRIPGLSTADAARLQYTARGAHGKRNYDGLFPSANASFNLRHNLLLRASYAETISRPNLNEIIPGMTVTDPNTSNTNNLLITITNSGLSPWTARNYDLALEYYFGKTGSNVLSIGGFRKEIKNFFATRRTDATPELLTTWGLDDSYLLYDVQTKFNAGDATVEGYEINYRQGLTFLPHWARGVDVFYNMNSQRLAGTTLADFSNFVRRSDNYGFSVSRPRFTVRVKVNDLGRQRRNLITGTNLSPSTYRWRAPRRSMDVDFEYRIRRGLSFFISGRNVNDAPSRFEEVYGIGTPEYARPNSYWLHAVNYVFGFKGSF